MGFLDNAKKAAKEAGDKVKDTTTKFKDDLKEQEAKNNELRSLPMEERIKLRPEGVKYCLVNNTGRILDVYENKVIFTSTKSTSTAVTAVIFGTSATAGEKTIYYKDAIGVQFKLPSITDGYLQVETAAGNMTTQNSQYSSENSFTFGSSLNEDAQKVADYIRARIEEFKTAAPAATVIQAAPVEESPVDTLKKLAELKDLGVITEEEFNQKKSELLAKM